MVYKVSEKIAADILDVVNQAKSGQLTIIGKIYSNLGQVYAFLENFEKAREAFQIALEKFSYGTENYKITQSYYLHLLIEHNKKHEYCKESESYFGASNIK